MCEYADVQMKFIGHSRKDEITNSIKH